ncbi:MAG: response regulator [Gemmatimonadetes bacterium]|nr:response regulator [Gemmatimonadota bacterium]
MNGFAKRMAGWAREARRRRVYVPIGAYLVIGVTIIELSDAVFEALLLPEWSSRLVTVLLILGFPVVMALAWIFDITPQGVRRTEQAQGTGIDAAGVEAASGPPAKSPADARAGRPPPKMRRISPSQGTARPGVSAGPAPEEEAEPGAPPDPERVKRAALTHVRHELKTPINAILGYSEMLLEDLEDGEDELEKDLERIRTAGRNLLTLVDEILNPNRIAEEGSSAELEDYGAKIRVDLRNPINAVIGYAELLIENSKEMGRDYMVADLDRIQAAARRLLDLSTDIVEVATARNEDSSDPGRLEVSSALTEGVLAKAGTDAGAVQTDEVAGSLLVVDDNAMNRDLLSRQLARAGFMVQTAESGAEALRIMDGRDFDLVLLDVIMPEMDGLEVLRRVKSDPHLAETPVIVLSSLDDVESAIRCIELGADDFLHKPFHPTLLQARIGASLEIRRRRDEHDRQLARLDESELFVERILRSSFPAAIADRIRSGETEIVESYGDVTVLWCDVESAARDRTRDPSQVAGRMRRLLEALDRVAEEHELGTVVQAGDGVVLAGGVPIPAEDHAHRVASAALALRDGLRSDPSFDAPIRVGMDSGEVTGGVLGGERLGYRLWGDPVDLARSLGRQAETGQVMVSPSAYRLLKDGWAFATLGVQEIPGRGQMRTYVLEGPA